MQMLSYHPPLMEQIIGKDLQTFTASSLGEADRPWRYKIWNAESMAKAIAAVQKTECTIREASEILKSRSQLFMTGYLEK